MVGVYLVHGTFGGDDASGLLTELARFAPGLSKSLRKFEKSSVDALMGETGNYTAAFAARLEELVSEGAGRPIPVRRFNWSSQNNHIGRAEGAIQLLDEFARFVGQLPAYQLHGERPPRLLVWGHSHGGNCFAIITNLLGGDEATRRDFFHAARPFYRTLWSGRVDAPAWDRVEALLADAAHPLRRVTLDVATFGTPIRYGWDAGGYAKLMHFVNHRPTPDRPEYLAPSPIVPRRMLTAADGDYVQQIGIAGADVPPPLAPRAILANWRLRSLLQRGLRSQWLTTRLKQGRRVPDEGATLLMDYDNPETNPLYHLFGHAAYTRSRWLPLHCEQVAAEFYGSSSGMV